MYKCPQLCWHILKVNIFVHSCDCNAVCLLQALCANVLLIPLWVMGGCQLVQVFRFLCDKQIQLMITVKHLYYVLASDLELK